MKEVKTHVRRLCAAGLAGVLFVACENDIEEVNKLTQYEHLPAQTIRGSRIIYTDSGRVEFELEAGQIERYREKEENRDEFSKGVKVVTFDKRGNFESLIMARNATNYPDDKLMIARDSVYLRNFEDKVLETELLVWDDKQGRIYTDKFVRITTPTEVLYGDGLEANRDFSEYEILNIKGRISIEENPDTPPNENNEPE